jgi:hypothetical protein
MKAFLVAYDFRGLHKKLKLKIVDYGYVRGCSKRPATQIWSLEILGIKNLLLNINECNNRSKHINMIYESWFTTFIWNSSPNYSSKLYLITTFNNWRIWTTYISLRIKKVVREILKILKKIVPIANLYHAHSCKCYNIIFITLKGHDCIFKLEYLCCVVLLMFIKISMLHFSYMDVQANYTECHFISGWQCESTCVSHEDWM